MIVVVEVYGSRSSNKSDAEVDAMSDGDFYLYMLTQDHCTWAKWANKKSQLGLNPLQEGILATWFANAMCAVVDRPRADYIRARIDSESSQHG